MVAHFNVKWTQQITIFINFKLHFVLPFFGHRPQHIFLRRLCQNLNLKLLLVYALLSFQNFTFILLALRIHENMTLVIFAAFPWRSAQLRSSCKDRTRPDVGVRQYLYVFHISDIDPNLISKLLVRRSTLRFCFLSIINLISTIYLILILLVLCMVELS